MLEGETLYSVPAAFERATGQRIHQSTAHRMRLRGSHGVRLVTVKVSGRRMTSVEAVQRFIEACTRAADGEPAAPPISRTNRQAAAAQTDAEAQLIAAGA